MGNIFEELAQEANNNSNAENTMNNAVIMGNESTNNNDIDALFGNLKFYKNTEYVTKGKCAFTRVPIFKNCTKVSVVDDYDRDGLQAKIHVPGGHYYCFLDWALGKLVKVGDLLNKDMLDIEVRQKEGCNPIFVLIAKQ